MNKKFSTLLASFLLAGGLFNANAESFTDLNLSKDKANNGNWYYVYVNNTGAATTANGMLTLGNTNLYEMEKDAADVWQVVAVLDASKNVVGYKLQNQNGKPLEVKVAADGGTTTYNTFIESTSGQYLAFSNTVGFAGDLTATSSTSWQYDLVEAECQPLTASELNYYEKDGFSVTISYIKNNVKKSLAGNPFAGHLVPMSWNGTKFGKATDVDNFYLYNPSSKKYIVATQFDGEGATTAQDIYGFEAVSEETLKHNLVRSASNLETQKYFGEFKVCANINDYKNANKGAKKLSALCCIEVKLGDEFVDLGRYDFSSVATLVASAATDLYPINVELGGGEVVDWTTFLQKGKFYTVELWDASKKAFTTKLTATGCEQFSAEFLASCGNVLEAQWALTYDGTNYVFTNRENLEASWTLDAATLYYSDKDNEYKSGEYIYRIKTVAAHAATDGYTTLNITDETTFNIAYASGVYGNAWFTENHTGETSATSHKIGLNIEKENALAFTAEEFNTARKATVDAVDGHKTLYTPTDTIYVISQTGFYNTKTKQPDVALDTLKVLSYTFVNQYGEFLAYDYEAGMYATNVKNNRENKAVAQNFALRNDNGKLNLVPVALTVGSQVEGEQADDASDMYQVLDYSEGWVKVYAGDAANGLLDNVCLYDRTENDLFVVEATEAPVYRRLVNAIDTVSIYRDENASQLLYEDGAFLGLKNENQFEIAPAMLADTAYVRNETYKPLYMLAVDATIVPEGKYCPVHGVDAGCKDEHLEEVAGWVEGRYLVCLADSADAWATANPSKHAQANPYMYDGMYKLGFVPAIHKNDSLIITHEDAKKVKRYFLGEGKMNPGTFAFRYVDEETGSFLIETHCGWIKWINGNVVVTDEVVEADVFNMNEEEGRTPTANEEIAADGVTVIAGNGNVTIAGAAGKKVVIANILGQTVANTVLTSDNATIAAPAGVVVVKVEGEAAVKAIVK